jgi:hypothetical protein
MENTIDLRKTGAENIIGNSVKHSFSTYYVCNVRTVRSSWEQISDCSSSWNYSHAIWFPWKRPSGDSKHCEDRESEANVMRENTVFELAMLVRTMAKVRCRCTMIHMGHVHWLRPCTCDEHNGRYQKHQKPPDWGPYYISVENIWYSSNNAGGVTQHEYIRTAIHLGVIAVVLRHRRWVNSHVRI